MDLSQSSSTRILKSKPALADRFEVVEVVGEGASGAVYRVKDRMQGGREVALKILLNNAAFDENTLQRFVAELRILQKIQHPNIVEAYDLIELGETIAFTMEYVPGSDLGELFRSRRIQHDEIDPIFRQILSALHELHRHGIVHRDIKLENILITADGHVKLSDLGLMKCGELDGMTKTGVLLGTAQYMPPEYVRGSMYDQRGDLYAVGLMLYELLTCKRRLSDKNGNEALEYLIKTRFQIPRITLTGLPRRYLDIIDRALDPDPEMRFQSAVEMREAFDAFQSVTEDGGGHGKPTSQSLEMKRFCEISALSQSYAAPVSRRPRYIAGTVMLLILACGTLGMPYIGALLRTPVTLEGGIYDGTMNIAGTLKKLRLNVSSQGVGFESALDRCDSGPVDLQSGKILCERSGLQLMIESQERGAIRGAVVDLENREHYKFAVQRSAGYSAAKNSK
ncbi:MAG: serine/threonine protein kinase [Deltaproteobacteria bacterium]|nr:serine/threonine protein kinase [Deltaproteobacteria bacterium]